MSGYNVSTVRRIPWYDRPLNCHGALSDGFSGWYAVGSRGEACSDFCFWDTKDTHYNANNTIDPHQHASTPTSYWRCALQADKNHVTWSNLEETTLITAPGELGDAFIPQRCSRGSGEVLETRGSKIIESSTGFWSFTLTASLCILLAQVAVYGVRMYKRKRKETMTTDNDDDDDHGSAVGLPLGDRDEETIDDARDITMVSPPTSNGVDEAVSVDQIPPKDDSNEERLDSSDEETPAVVRREVSPLSLPTKSSQSSWKRRCLQWIKILLWIVGNLILIYVAFQSCVVLTEISGEYFSESSFLQRATPACSNPRHVCPKASQNLNRPSLAVTSSNNEPFSYLIASDPQFPWWDGQSSTMGSQLLPTPCTESDSCDDCTQKVGTYTNRQMKKSIETLIDGGRASATDGPIPKTLVMNGDLTAYFHPEQRDEYESIYHRIAGLEAYFPGLGNHDIQHDEGATYAGDEWPLAKNRKPNCNAAHSMEYLLGGMCGAIPHFLLDRLTRYDASSLAYSWEEGRYHFVQVHYYPSYENARLGIGSSLEWLERDLTLASQTKLTSILLIHAAEGLNHAMEPILANKNVAAVFAGHSHRCLGRKCAGPATLNEEDIQNWNATRNDSDSMEGPPDTAKCFPARASLCGSYPGGDMFYIENKTGDWTLPDTKLWVPPWNDDGVCYKSPPIYINKMDNTLLCRGATYRPPEFSASETESIPIFWSGSSSYETFLKVDFYDDRLVVNAISAEAGSEGMLYTTVRDVPNAVYPYHERSDLENITVYL